MKSFAFVFEAEDLVEAGRVVLPSGGRGTLLELRCGRDSDSIRDSMVMRLHERLSVLEKSFRGFPGDVERCVDHRVDRLVEMGAIEGRVRSRVKEVRS